MSRIYSCLFTVSLIFRVLLLSSPTQISGETITETGKKRVTALTLIVNMTPAQVKQHVISLAFSALSVTGNMLGSSTITGQFSFDPGTTKQFSQPGRSGYSYISFTVIIDGTIGFFDDSPIYSFYT